MTPCCRFLGLQGKALLPHILLIGIHGNKRESSVSSAPETSKVKVAVDKAKSRWLPRTLEFSSSKEDWVESR